MNIIEKSTEELNIKDLIPLQSGVRRKDSVKRSNLNDRKELKEPQKGNEEMGVFREGNRDHAGEGSLYRVLRAEDRR